MQVAASRALEADDVDAVDIEAELARLVDQIEYGVDPVLDEFRRSGSGDTSYSTSINRQVRAFSIYRRYAETGRSFLDWGCRHAWDSCMVRMVNNDAAIHGCDITSSIAPATQRFARLDYTELTHPWQLPYPDGKFDRVICSGVLEHAPVSSASLVELNRVMESGGYLIITFLPNKLSYTEFACRNVFKQGQHRRLYSLAKLKDMLLHHGFEPVEAGHHQLLPSLTMGHRSLRWPWLGRLFRTMFKADPVAERIWPIKLFCANLYTVARKRDYM